VKAAVAVAAIVLSVIRTASAAPVEDDGFAPWSTHGAITVPRGRWELALFGNSRYGLTERFELALHPVVFFALPHVEAKLRFWQVGRWSAAVRSRLSYPTPFLNLVSKEGSGGLLPATTDVPQALELEADGLVSFRFHERQLVSFAAGLAVAPRSSSDDFPLLDFPFLYPRFAPLYSWGVPRFDLNVEGQIVGGLHYAADFRAYLLFLDDVEGEFALEQALASEYRFGARVALELGMRASLARYPVGTRLHFLPYFDVKIGF
jgi:hypothetical protein